MPAPCGRAASPGSNGHPHAPQRAPMQPGPSPHPSRTRQRPRPARRPHLPRRACGLGAECGPRGVSVVPRARSHSCVASNGRAHASCCTHVKWDSFTLEVLSVSMCATSTRAPPAMMSMRHAAGFERHASCREIGCTARCACAAPLHRRAPAATARGDLHVCVHARASTPTGTNHSRTCGRVVVGLRARSANTPQ